MTKKVLIRNASQIVTPQGHSACFGKAMGDVKVYENTSIFIEDGIIKGIGDPAQWEKEVPRETRSMLLTKRSSPDLLIPIPTLFLADIVQMNFSGVWAG